MVVNLKANEVVLKAGNTDQLLGDRKIPGKLIVTNQRIYFKSLETNYEEMNLELNPENILEVIYFNTRKFIPNGLNVVTKAGESLRFILKKRNDFGQLINRMY